MGEYQDISTPQRKESISSSLRVLLMIYYLIQKIDINTLCLCQEE